MASERNANAPRTSGTKSTIITRFHSTKKQPKLLPKTSNIRSDNGLITLRYEDSAPAKPPIPVTVAPPRSPPQEQHPAFRRPMSSVDAKLEEDRKRDSGLAPTTTSSNRGTGSVKTVEDHALGVVINFDNTSSAMSTPQSPTIEQSKDVQVPQSPSIAKNSMSSESKWRLPGSRKNSVPRTPENRENRENRESSQEDFSPITTPIPTDSLLDDGFMDGMSFSKRGSIMFGGKKAVNKPGIQARVNVGRRYLSAFDAIVGSG